MCLSASAGVGRTGVFITLSIVLERMRYEGVVDLFQTVKTLRTQRPAMVQTEVCRTCDIKNRALREAKTWVMILGDSMFNHMLDSLSGSGFLLISPTIYAFVKVLFFCMCVI